MSGLCGNSGGYVSGYLNNHIERAEEAVLNAFNALKTVSPTIIGSNAEAGSVNSALVFNPNITADAVEVIPYANIEVHLPNSVRMSGIKEIKLGAIPELDATKPNATIPSAPPDGMPDDIYSSDIDTSLDIPDAPELIFDTAPDLTPINIPDIIALDISDFNGNVPDYGIIQQPDGSFNYTDVAYDSEVVTQVENRMVEMRDNDWGIPDYIWNLAWQQGRERETIATNKLLDEVDIDMASRGFSLPQGIQLARQDTIRQANLAKTITISREQIMAQEQQKVENFKFHVQQGIAFEQVRGQWHDQAQNRILDAEKFAFQSIIELFNANIEFFNARVSVFKTEADVYKIQIDAEVAKLEAQKVELEAQKLVSEINKDAVAIYTAKIEALNSKANVYKTQVDAAVSVLESAKIEVSKFAQDINNYNAQVNKETAKYELFKTKADVATIEYENYSIAAQAFSAEVQAYKLNADAQAVRNSNTIEQNKLYVSEYEAELKGVNIKLQSQIATLDSQLKLYQASIDIYKTEVGISKMNVDARLQMTSNEIQYASQLTQASIQNAKSASDNSLANANAAVERTNAIGQLYTGLASASLSAGNISMSHGFSDSVSCSTSYSG